MTQLSGILGTVHPGNTCNWYKNMVFFFNKKLKVIGSAECKFLKASAN